MKHFIFPQILFIFYQIQFPVLIFLDSILMVSLICKNKKASIIIEIIKHTI